MEVPSTDRHVIAKSKPLAARRQVVMHRHQSVQQSITAGTDEDAGEENRRSSHAASSALEATGETVLSGQDAGTSKKKQESKQDGEDTIESNASMLQLKHALNNDKNMINSGSG